MIKTKKKKRSEWNDYFLQLAKMVSNRSTCDRLSVGAVITKDNRILATGYNGSLPGAPHCDDVGHLLVHGHCKRTVHAEVNAITQAARHGISIEDATIYITHSPCLDCFKVIVASGIKAISFKEAYRLTEKDLDVYRQATGCICIREEDPIWNIDLETKRWYR